MRARRGHNLRDATYSVVSQQSQRASSLSKPAARYGAGGAVPPSPLEAADRRFKNGPAYSFENYGPPHQRWPLVPNRGFEAHIITSIATWAGTPAESFRI